MLLYYGLAKGFLEGLRRTGPNLTRENYVHTFETAMNGYDSGYTPPPTYTPGHHTGPLEAGVTKCCNGGQWFSPTPGWFTTFEPSAGGGGGAVKTAPALGRSVAEGAVPHLVEPEGQWFADLPRPVELRAVPGRTRAGGRLPAQT